MTAVGQNTSGDGSRFYVDPLDTDRVFDSVTTIIKATTGAPWLTDWSARLAAEYAVTHLDLVATVAEMDSPDAAVDLVRKAAERRRDDARDRGTAVHDLIEGIILERPLPVRADLVPYVDGLSNFVTDFDVEFEMAEATVANSEHMFAGTLDIVAMLHKLGRRLIVDAKTGRLDAGMAPQLAAYQQCDEVWLPFDLRAPLPTADGAAVLHLRPEYDGGYKLFEVEDLPAAYEWFLDMRRVYGRRQTARSRPGRVLYPPLPDGSQPVPLIEDVDGWGRARAVLMRHGFTTLGEISRTSPAALLELSGFGPKTLAAVADMLAAHDMTLTSEGDHRATA